MPMAKELLERTQQKGYKRGTTNTSLSNTSLFREFLTLLLNFQHFSVSCLDPLKYVYMCLCVYKKIPVYKTKCVSMFAFVCLS